MAEAASAFSRTVSDGFLSSYLETAFVSMISQTLEQTSCPCPTNSSTSKLTNQPSHQLIFFPQDTALFPRFKVSVQYKGIREPFFFLDCFHYYKVG